MANLGIRDDPEQEGWEKMGPMGDPTPTNAKNRGVADKKKRRGEENRHGNEGRDTSTSPKTTKAEGRRERDATS
jgi:hypothetical protein